jgi:hypothetical protein
VIRVGVVAMAVAACLQAQTASINGVGNQALLVTWELHLPLALCNSTSTLMWGAPPSGTAATAGGCTGSNVDDGAGVFANTGNPSLQFNVNLPQTLTGTADVYVAYSTSTASGTFTMALDAVCTATNSTATDDPSFSANNFFAPGSATASGTASQVGTVSATGISWPAGCTAGMRAHFRLIRTDTTGTATSLNVYEVVIVGRRTM